MWSIHNTRYNYWIFVFDRISNKIFLFVVFNILRLQPTPWIYWKKITQIFGNGQTHPISLVIITLCLSTIQLMLVIGNYGVSTRSLPPCMFKNLIQNDSRQKSLCQRIGLMFLLLFCFYSLDLYWNMHYNNFNGKLNIHLKWKCNIVLQVYKPN